MNISAQYEKPLLLLFSDFNISELDALLLDNDEIVLRQKKRSGRTGDGQKRDGQKLDKQSRDRSFSVHNHSWNIQFQGLEFDMFWVDDNVDISQHKQIFCNISDSMFSSAIAIDLGVNVRCGRKNAAVMQSFFQFIHFLIPLTQPIAAIWNVSKIITDPSYLLSNFNDYSNGGLFPILPFIDFIIDKADVIRSRGLSYFSDQEILYNIGHLSPIDVIKRMSRMAHDIAVNGDYSHNMIIEGLAKGEQIAISVDADGLIVRAQSIFCNIDPNL